MNVLGTPNPAYVTHPSIGSQNRIHVDGFHDSQCELVVALVQLKDGTVGVVVDNAPATFQNFIRVHALLSKVAKEMDHRLLLHAQTVEGEK